MKREAKETRVRDLDGILKDHDTFILFDYKKMSAAQCWEKVAELEQMAKGCIRHSEAMRRWIGVTFQEQAAAQ